MKIGVAIAVMASVGCMFGDMAFHTLDFDSCAVMVDGKAERGVASIEPDGTVKIMAEHPISQVELSWKASFPAEAKALGGEWERTYGDSAWHAIGKSRDELPRGGAMPWYFLVNDGKRTDGYGVAVQPNVFACWFVTTDGIRLVLDCRAGKGPVNLKGRELAACKIVTYRGNYGDSAFAAGRQFCRMMCPAPRMPKAPVYGYNDWYCAYGKNTATNFLADAAKICGLVKGERNRPYVVADHGWELMAGLDEIDEKGPWITNNPRWGMKMDEFARKVREMGAHPGLWYRPFLPDEGTKAIPIDPTDGKWKARIASDLRRFADWGMDLVKADFITRDWANGWGFAFTNAPMKDTVLKWKDDSRTGAEVIKELYEAMRAAAGDRMIIIGCNALDHFAAGLFELQRTGDDTSGKDWQRTLKMGPNTIATRAMQNGTFYLGDGDCVGLAENGAIDWRLNRQWLDLVAKSGTALFISWKRELLTPEICAAFQIALRRAANPQPTCEPLDWLSTATPTRWRQGNEITEYTWGVSKDELTHPDSSGPEWEDVFNRELSNAVLDNGPCTNGLWAWGSDGLLTPHTDATLLSKKSWGSFVLDCEYKCDETGNSGIFFYDTVHPSDKIEMQILDDHHPMYIGELPYQFSGSLYGHCPASQVVSNPAGEWNRATIWARGDDVRVMLNGVEVVHADLAKWKSQLVNPDGTDTPPWQRTFVPWARLAKWGRIGLQGIHGGKAAHFRYLRIKPIDPPAAHPADTSDWEDLVKRDFSNVEPMNGVWSFDKDGCLVATKDVNLVTKDTYSNFAVDLEFQMEPGANAGVFVYASNLTNWVPNKIEVQLMDDHHPRNEKYPAIWKNCSLYGHIAPWKDTLKKAGEWNRLTVYCEGKHIRVAQNGEFVLDTYLDNFKNAARNPDGTDAPKLHTVPWCKLATFGRIGLQGKHEGIATRFRNMKVKTLGR